MLTLNEALKIAGLPQRADEARGPRTHEDNVRTVKRLRSSFERNKGTDFFDQFKGNASKIAAHLKGLGTQLTDVSDPDVLAAVKEVFGTK